MAKVSLRAYNREIEEMIDRGQVDEAIGHCRHILQTFPKHLDTYRILGKTYLESKRYNEAVDIFQRLLASVPSDFVAHVGMSIIRDEENKLDDAIWHMERAFETQPSNAAIQGELQRLYGRRGEQVARVRMTRGALANMYVQGELYPQAISEIRGVLKEDPNRVDMQTLLAKAAFKSGQKNGAAEVASQLLRQYPYNLDANRVLVEILSSGERAESALTYRQRVVEMDPYAAQVSDSVFHANEVADAAVNLERWPGEPAGERWDIEREIDLSSKPAGDEQPDWLKRGGFAEEPAVSFAPQPVSVTPTPAVPLATPPPAQEEDIPGFLREAGWGKSTGAFDESTSEFTEEPSPAQPIEQGELPDWIKAMAPPQMEQPSAEPAVSGEPVSDADSLGWLNQLSDESRGVPSVVPVEEPERLRQVGDEVTFAAPVPPIEEQPVEETAPASAAGVSAELDWLKELSEPTEQPAVPPAPSAVVDTRELGKSEQEREDSFAWLESLAARQGASEGLLTEPEERLEKEPDWVQQAKELSAQKPLEEVPIAETPLEQTLPPAEELPVSLEDLGKSDREREDSFAWLESLAARQGASEGLLTQPEERLEKEPDWVEQAKELGGGQPSVPQEPAAEPVMPAVPPADETASWLRGLDQEPAVDETAAWLRGLDESAEVKPAEPAPSAEEAEAVDWSRGFEADMRKEDIFGLYGVPPVPSAPPPVPVEQPVEEEKSITAWLHSLEQEEMPPTPPPVTPQPATEEELPDWLHGLEGEKPVSELAPAEELPAWLRTEPEPAPGRAEDWRPVEAKAEAEQPEAPMPAPLPVQPVEVGAEVEQPEVEMPAPSPVQPVEVSAEIEQPEELISIPSQVLPVEVEKPKKVKEPVPSKPVVPEYKEPVTAVRRTGMLTTPTIDLTLSQARTELSRSNIPGAL